MRRRKPDSIELQQMKAQAKEEKTRRQLERARLLREKELREEAEKELLAIEQRLLQYQEDAHGAQEALRRSDETAGLLAEKARVAEEEAMLLSQKAAEAEAEIQRIKISAIKTEEEKHMMQRKAEDAELLASTLMEESNRRAKESEQLREELYNAKLSEKQTQDKLLCLIKTIHHSSASSSASLSTHHLHTPSLTKNNSVIINNNNINNGCDVLVGSSLDLGNDINGLELSNSNPHNVNLSVQPTDYIKNTTYNKPWCLVQSSNLPKLSVSDSLPYVNSNSNGNPNDATNLTKMVSEINDLRVKDMYNNNDKFDNTTIYSNLSNSLVNYLNPTSNNNSFCSQNFVSESTLTNSKASFASELPDNTVVVSDNLIDSNSHEFINSFTDSDLQKLEFEVEKERIEYLQKSKHLQEQLQDLKTEIQVLKVDDRLTDLDRIHEENASKGENKYSTLKRTLSGTTKKRVAFFEEL